MNVDEERRKQGGGSVMILEMIYSFSAVSALLLSSFPSPQEDETRAAGDVLTISPIVYIDGSCQDVIKGSHYCRKIETLL